MVMCLKLNSIQVIFLQKEHATRHDKIRINIYCITNLKFFPKQFALNVAENIAREFTLPGSLSVLKCCIPLQVCCRFISADVFKI